MRDPLSENLADFGPVPALLAITLHPTLLVDDAALDDPIADGLADDVLRIFLRVKMELHADVAEGDTRVRERETADACLDDVLAKADDERVRLVRFELSRVLRQRRLELR